MPIYNPPSVTATVPDPLNLNSITGSNISASFFFGNGSNLTNIVSTSTSAISASYITGSDYYVSSSGPSFLMRRLSSVQDSLINLASGSNFSFIRIFNSSSHASNATVPYGFDLVCSGANSDIRFRTTENINIDAISARISSTTLGTTLTSSNSHTIKSPYITLNSDASYGYLALTASAQVRLGGYGNFANGGVAIYDGNSTLLSNSALYTNEFGVIRGLSGSQNGQLMFSNGSGWESRNAIKSVNSGSSVITVTNLSTIEIPQNNIIYLSASSNVTGAIYTNVNYDFKFTLVNVSDQNIYLSGSSPNFLWNGTSSAITLTSRLAKNFIYDYLQNFYAIS
jgi:hypothetical protein